MLARCAGIAWQKKTHFKYFKNRDNYKKFYKILVSVTRCHTVPLSDVMQRKLVQWLQRHGEGKAAVWFEKYWTGDRGNWCKAHGGVGGTNNNNGPKAGGVAQRNSSAATAVPLQVIFCINSA